MRARWGTMRGQRGVLALIVVIVLLLIPAGVLAGDHGGAPASPVLLNVGMPDQPKVRNLLSSLAQDDPYTTAVLARVYDTAVQRNATTGAVVPRLAVGEDANGNGALDPAEVGAFDVSSSAPTITVFYNFTNARFHDGVSVTIMDVLFSYQLVALQAQMNGPLWVLMDQGGGAGSNFSTNRWLWVLPVDDGDGNPATAALRFSPQFAYPDFAFVTLGIPIFPRHEFEGTWAGRHPSMTTLPGCTNPDWGQAIYPETDPRAGQGIPVTETTYRPFQFSCAQAWQMTDADVLGSGHFKFGTWASGSFARLDANPDYAFGPPKVAGVLFKFYRSTQLGVLALRAGELDFLLYSLPVEFLPDLQNDPNVGLVSAPGLFPYSMVFNMRRLPFGYNTYPPADRMADVGLPFREAMQHLVDRATIVHTLLQDQGSIADGMIAPTNNGWHNTSLPAYAYDTAQAALILDNAGWTKTGSGYCAGDGTNCRSFPRLGTSQFEITTPQADYDPIMASAGAIVAAAGRSIGINVVSKPTPFGTIVDAMGARGFDMAIMGAPEVHPTDPWTLMRGDPDYLVDRFHSSNSPAGRNAAGFSDGLLDTVVMSSRREIDLAARTRDVKNAEGILADRTPVIPLYYRTLNWAYRADRFAGWRLIASTIFNYWSLQEVRYQQNLPPEIVLVSPAAGSLIRPGTPIDLDVRDANLRTVEYSVDGVPPSVLPAPYDVPTGSWTDGTHVLAVRAADPYTAVVAYYSFRVDGTPPTILSVTPGNGAVVPAARIIIEVRFSEAVNRTSAEGAFSIVAGSSTWRARDGAFAWANNSTSFRYVPAEPLPEGTNFEVRLSGNLTDAIGNPMGSAYISHFATPASLVGAVVLGGIAVIILVAVLGLLLLVMKRRRRLPPDPQR